MNRRFLELWVQALLDAVKISKSSEAFFNTFQNGFLKHSQESEFTKLLKSAFGTNGIESFNGLLKEFYDNIGVVPRTKYNALHDQYIDLLEKNHELEKTIRDLRKQFEGGKYKSHDFMEKWINTTETYTELNRKFLKEFSKFFK